MRGHIWIRLAVALLVMLVLSLARTGEARPEPAPAGAAAGGPASQLPADSVSQHTILADGKQLAYRAVAGTLPLAGPKGEIAAKIFYVAYTASGESARPVTFAFNGGPGAAAAFLHLGAIGPRIVPFEENGEAAERPDYQIRG